MGLLVGLLLLAMLSSVATIQVELNGKALAFSQSPTLINNRTMVPLRDIFEALGAKVGWDTDTMTVTASKDNTQVVLVIGQTSAMVNKQSVLLDTPAMLLGGHTMVPLRFVSEALGADVRWMDATQTVVITADLTAPVVPVIPPVPVLPTVPTTPVKPDIPDAPVLPVVPVVDHPVSTVPDAPATSTNDTIVITPDISAPTVTTGEITNTYQSDRNYTAPVLSMDELEDLLAPIALYPDPLLAQILPASTFPLQLSRAAQLIPLRGGNVLIDEQYWDVSVKAVAYYPYVLNMLARKPEWMTAIGQAYVNQPDDVMRAIQLLRARALSFGYLESNAQQRVYEEDGQIRIVPAAQQYIYVPRYDCRVVYMQRRYGDLATFMVFGDGMLIGVWLNRDMDWHHHRVYYHGWEGSGWVQHSRPHVAIHNTHYLNRNYFNKPVEVNRTVVNINISTYINGVKVNHGHPPVTRPHESQPSDSHSHPVKPSDNYPGTGISHPGKTGNDTTPNGANTTHADQTGSQHGTGNTNTGNANGDTSPVGSHKTHGDKTGSPSGSDNANTNNTSGDTTPRDTHKSHGDKTGSTTGSDNANTRKPAGDTTPKDNHYAHRDNSASQSGSGDANKSKTGSGDKPSDTHKTPGHSTGSQSGNGNANAGKTGGDSAQHDSSKSHADNSKTHSGSGQTNTDKSSSDTDKSKNDNKKGDSSKNN